MKPLVIEVTPGGPRINVISGDLLGTLKVTNYFCGIEITSPSTQPAESPVTAESSAGPQYPDFWTPRMVEIYERSAGRLKAKLTELELEFAKSPNTPRESRAEDGK